MQAAGAQVESRGARWTRAGSCLSGSPKDFHYARIQTE